MQKKLIAAAVVSALAVSTSAALADSANVSISGWVSAGIASYKRDASNASKELLVSDGRYSRIRFTGEEDLGGGLKAHFTLETRFVVDQGNGNAAATAFATGNQGVGLKSASMGTLTLGRWDLHYNEGTLAGVQDITLNQAQPLSHMAVYTLFSQTPGVGAAGYNQQISRYNNTILYQTPFWSGFYGKLAYSTNYRGNEGTGTNNGSKGAAINVVAGYLAGPIVAGVSYVDADIEGEDAAFNAATNFSYTGLRAWGAYTFPFGLKVGLMYDQTESATSLTNDRKRTAISVPVSFAFGNHVVHAEYGQADDYEDSTTGSAANTGATLISVGYDYKLSKRTSVGVDYATLKNDDNATYNMFLAGVGSLAGSAVTGAGQKVSEIYFGVNHLF